MTSTLDRAVCTPADDPRLAPLVEVIRGFPPAGDLAEKRVRVLADVEGDAAWLAAHGYAVEEVDAGGVPAQLITPPGPLGGGTLVTFHGGGYVLCSAGTHAKRVAVAGGLAGCQVLNVEYRLAPEHPFPAGVDDGLAAARWASARGPVVLAGDSAGGGLALSVALALRDAADPAVAPAGVVAISPWVDLTNTSASRVDRRARDPFAHVDDSDGYAAMYLGATPATDPLASPLFAELTGLPPLLVQVGSEEISYDDAIGIAEKAAAAGVPARFEEWVGMFHTWHTYVGALTGADEATAALARWVARHLHP